MHGNLCLQTCRVHQVRPITAFLLMHCCMTMQRPAAYTADFHLCTHNFFDLLESKISIEKDDSEIVPLFLDTACANW